MQTFSNMRRSSTNLQLVKIGFFVLIGIVYTSISSLNLWLPPLLGIYAVLFARFNNEDNYHAFVAVVFMIFFVECEYSIPMGSLLILFSVIYTMILPRIDLIIGNKRFNNLAYVIFVYLGCVAISYVYNSLFEISFFINLWFLFYFVIFEIIVVWFL